MTTPLPANPVVARVRRRFSASPERVFDAWLDPAMAGRFLFATPSGEMVRVEIDARVGGRYTITERRDGVDAEHMGEYLEIERPRRLVFTLRVDKDLPYIDRITVEIVPLDAGCELTIAHEMHPDMAAYAAQTEQGWAGILETLADVLAKSRAR